MTSAPVLSLRGISKRFAATQALSGVDMTVQRGEIHALLGENGAGKSTLIKILAGVHRPDDGEIKVNGKLADPRRDSLPIAFIHQDLGLVDDMTVAENIALVAGYANDSGLISWKKTVRHAEDILGNLGSAISPLAKLKELHAAERSLVAIARSLSMKADLIVLDEPTAALPEPDVAHLLKVLENLAAQGVSIIYVSHRLDEVFRAAHRVTVLRDGMNVGASAVKDTTPQQLVSMIIGRPLADLYPALPQVGQNALMTVSNLASGHVGPVSFTLREGEVLALAGLRGAGHISVSRMIYGLAPREAGDISIAGRAVAIRDARDAIAAGIGLVPNKRREEGLANGMSVKENVYLDPTVGGMPWYRLISPTGERRASLDLIQKLSVRPSNPDLTISGLSGGNQQKVVLARWFAAGARILILEEPTSGVDVGAKADVYRLIQEALSTGRSVLLISSDFEEVAGISHRALIFDRGRVAAELGREELSITRITAIAAGGESHFASTADAPSRTS